jgi:hypothetical protein
MSTDKNTPGEWRVRVRRDPWREPGTDGDVVDCFVQAPDVHGYAYDAEVLGDDEYREETGIDRKLADCQLIAAAPAMREALRWIRDELNTTPVNTARILEAVTIAFRKLDEVPR